MLAGGLATGAAAQAAPRPAIPATPPTTQLTLPFTGLSGPMSVAIGGGYVYVADTKHNRVVYLPIGATKTSRQKMLPFTGLDDPQEIAIGPNGDVYVVDSGNNRVVYMPPTANNSNQQGTVEMNGPIYPTGMTVDPSGDVYAANFSMGYVLELVKNATTSSFTPFGQLRQPGGMGSDPAGDAHGDAFVADTGNNRVVELAVDAKPKFVADTPPLAARRGSLYDYAFTASGVPAPTFDLKNAPSWLHINAATGRVYGTVPSLAAKNFSYAVTASNSQGNVTTTTFRVATAPGAVLSAALTCPKTVPEGKTGTCTLTVKNDGLDPATATMGEIELPLSLAKQKCSPAACVPHGNILLWSDGKLAVGKSVTQSVTFTAKQTGLSPVVGIGVSAVANPAPGGSVVLKEITVS